VVPEILILDFGSQYTQLIARRIRELNVYCEIHPYNKIPDYTDQIKGLILSGSPFSSVEPEAPQFDFQQFMGKVPILGICYGAQYIAKQLGGKVERSEKREYGKAMLSSFHQKDALTDQMNQPSQVWMSHGDTITQLPEQGTLLASTNAIEIAAFKLNGAIEKPVYGIQFHPEVTHSIEGKKLLKNFVKNICYIKPNFTPASFIEETLKDIKTTVGDDKVIMGLSGGVDSSVAATLIHKAIGDQLVGIFVDNGLLRKDEFEEVLSVYRKLGINVKGIDEKAVFFKALQNIDDPEQKRKIIGHQFIAAFM